MNQKNEEELIVKNGIKIFQPLMKNSNIIERSIKIVREDKIGGRIALHLLYKKELNFKNLYRVMKILSLSDSVGFLHHMTGKYNFKPNSKDTLDTTLDILKAHKIKPSTLDRFRIIGANITCSMHEKAEKRIRNFHHTM